MVNFALRLQSGVSNATFSYPDYEAYRDDLHSFSGVIAFYIDQLHLTGASGIISQRSAEAGSLIGRLGLLRPAASNAEFASTFIVSENYFSVLGVAALPGRAFEFTGLPELTASPSVLISENYWQRRFAGDPAVRARASASMAPPLPSSELRLTTSPVPASPCPIFGCRSVSIR